jgi:mono/diheme cytochrome c family protein
LDGSVVKCDSTSKSTAKEPSTASGSATTSSTEDGLRIAGSYSLGTEVTFSHDIRKIIQNSCIECHSASKKNQEPLMDTYDQVRRVAVRSLTQMKSDSMPPQTASNRPNSGEIELYGQWITDGTLYGLDPTRENDPPPGTAYNNAIRDFLGENCISCHKADNSQPPVLTNYDAAFKAASSSLAQLTAGKMPPKVEFDSKSVALFTEWKRANYQLSADTTSAGSDSGSDTTDDGAEGDSTSDSGHCLQ